MNKTILYVNYEGESAVPIIEALRIEEYEVIEVGHDIEAVEYVESHKIDMLILDYGSKGNEFEVISQLRTRMGFFLILILSDIMMSEKIIKGFAAGANEYITKPVQIEIVLVRIRNLFNLIEIENTENNLPITIGELYIDPRSRMVRRNTQSIELTPKEYDLLLYLARHVNQVCSRERILKLVWKYDYSLGTNVVDVYIRYLRLKIDKGHRHKMIHTSRGVGYILIGE
ncbi:response regulator transcription factor [Paenibacillus sp. FA6]|uniref:response regulator transcription factor n=1 Tax=Paenibacillus sp. FA6 TaxID=3413029 RepID=UPI003F659E07